MAKDKKITVGAINVTIQPHTPERYIQLFKSASRVKKPVKVHGDQFGLLAGARNLTTNQEKTGPITGDVYKFTNIDFNNNWFNIETNNFASEEELDQADSEALYRILEEEVVPLYFDRDSDGVPRSWVQVVKEAIRTAAPVYSARRMVKEYTDRMYVPAMSGVER